jgi:hypothetical protein
MWIRMMSMMVYNEYRPNGKTHIYSRKFHNARAFVPLFVPEYMYHYSLLRHPAAGS